MLHFDIHLEPAPLEPMRGEAFVLDGQFWPTILVSHSNRTRSLASFDEALTALAKLPRMYAEPDGSFVWVGDSEQDWQVDGNLFDRGDQLAHVALKGQCPAAVFEQLLRCFGWPETPLVFQLCRQGVYVDEPTFRALADRPPK